MTKPPSGVSEEEEPPDVLEEEEPPPTSLWSRPMKPPAYVREEERCDGDSSFPHPGVKEEEWCGSREK
jgi:hypothetical protein